MGTPVPDEDLPESSGSVDISDLPPPKADAITMPDYLEMLERAAQIQLPPHVVSYLTASLAGPRLAKHLGEYPDYLKRIVGLAPAETVRALTQLEINLHESEFWLSMFLADLNRQRLATWQPTHIPN